MSFGLFAKKSIRSWRARSWPRRRAWIIACKSFPLVPLLKKSLQRAGPIRACLRNTRTRRNPAKPGRDAASNLAGSPLRSDPAEGWRISVFSRTRQESENRHVSRYLEISARWMVETLQKARLDKSWSLPLVGKRKAKMAQRAGAVRLFFSRVNYIKLSAECAG